MGIKGLLVYKASYVREAHLSDFSGLTAAVDTYAWLHRGNVCMRDRSDSEGVIAMGTWTFACRGVNLLKDNGIGGAVFDGANLPSKSGTEKNRAAKRKASREKGMKLYADQKLAEAHACFTRRLT